MEYGYYMIFGVFLILFIIFIQPAVQLYLLLRKPRSKMVRTIGVIGLCIHSVFLLLFFYSSSFKGMFNFSGHGGKEIPQFIVNSMTISIIASILFFILFVAALFGNRVNNLNN